MELPVRIERTSEHYKCPVLTFVLWEHILYGRGGWIRTNVCRSQSPVPYHLAIPLGFVKVLAFPP